MNAQMKKTGSAVRQSKFLVVPAVIIGGWLALFGSVVTAISRPLPLQASIEKVLGPGPAAEPTSALVARR
jgi:hypothetical protein